MRKISLTLVCVSLACIAACSSGRRPVGDGGIVGGDGGSGDMGNVVLGKVTQVVVTTGTPSDAPMQFGGASDPGSAPTVVYPPNGVIMPPNISELEIQWKPVAGTNVFELHFVSTYLDLSVYTTCTTVGTGCGYQPDSTVWQLMATQSRGDTMTLTVSASGGAGTGVGAATSQTISFTEEDLTGGLYYWAAAAGEVVRYDFGNSSQTAETFYNAGDAGSICVGCHALARNGTRIAVGLNAPIPLAGLRVLDIATKTPLFTMGASNFEAFSPDASRLLANDGAGNLNLLDGATGAVIGSAPVIMSGNLPDWAADGSKVVFSRSGSSSCPIPALCANMPGVDGASLFTASVTGDSFGAPTQIVTGGGNNFYPTFSPDGTIVAFDRSAAGNNSFDASDARVWVVDANGGTPVELTNADSFAGDSWPKFAPFTQHFKGETIFWLTFSSRRDYGLRILNSTAVVTSNSDDRVAQVWMVGVPASAIAAGGMPSGGYPALWLPFQSMKSGNHIAQWTETVARQPCSLIDGSSCPGGDVCQNGVCVGQPIL